MLYPEVFLSPRQVKAFCSGPIQVADKIATDPQASITPPYVRRVVPLDLLSSTQLDSLITVIQAWKRTIPPPASVPRLALSTSSQPPAPPAVSHVGKRARNMIQDSSPSPSPRCPPGAPNTAMQLPSLKSPCPPQPSQPAACSRIPRAVPVPPTAARVLRSSAPNSASKPCTKLPAVVRSRKPVKLFY